MTRNHIESNDPLDRLFSAAREETVADNGFSRRVTERLEPLPPSKNLYRVPTFATALASVLLWGTLMLSGFDFGQLLHRTAGESSQNREEATRSGGLRLLPQAWTLSHTSSTNLTHSTQEDANH